MKRYQRGFIVALLGLMATTFVKVIGISSTTKTQGGWRKLSISDVQRIK